MSSFVDWSYGRTWRCKENHGRKCKLLKSSHKVLILEKCLENVYIWQCLFFDILKVLKIIDVDNKGYASKEDIQGMTLEQLKQIANEVDDDPANTEEYEFALFEIDSVR